MIGIIPLSPNADAKSTLGTLLQLSSWSSAGINITNPAINKNTDFIGPIHANYIDQRMKCTYIAASNSRDMMSILDVAKVADVLLMVTSCDEDWENSMFDEQADTVMSCLKAVGMPDLVVCLQGLEKISPKKYNETRRNALRNLESALVVGIKTFEVPATDFIGSVKFKNDSSGGNKNPMNACRSMLRALSDLTVKDISWRSMRSYVPVDSLNVTENPCKDQSDSDIVREDQGGERCGLTLTGYVRGKSLPVNSLMHIVGVGTCRVVQISSKSTPFQSTEGQIQSQIQVCHATKTLQDSLDPEAEADTLMGEQTWPTSAELAAASANEMMDRSEGRNRRSTAVPVKVPKGMSDYQADWFIDEDGQWDEDLKKEEDADDGEERIVGVRIDDPIEQIENDGDDMTIGGSIIDEPDARAYSLAEKRQLAKLRRNEEQEHEEFPDEIDTPLDVEARVRFARYRALQSFRTSPWHPKENLPGDYSRIYQFANFNLTQKQFINQTKEIQQVENQMTLKGKGNTKNKTSADYDDEGMDVDADGNSNQQMQDEIGNRITVPGHNDVIKSGHYVEIILGDVPVPDNATLNALKPQHFCCNAGLPLLFSLLPHENKMTVLHFNLTRVDDDANVNIESNGDVDGIEMSNTDEDELQEEFETGDTVVNDLVVKAKDELLFHAGFRTYHAKPVFSEANLNCDKHKFERFLRPGAYTVASVFGPVNFLPCPLLVFKKDVEGKPKLLGVGSLASVDPDRIILKKVMLTGYPMRIKKKFAVVKHMFYNPKDVRWFKPAELHTKFGLRGNIRESLGGKGLFKAIFSAPITQNDTVCLTLYKRVYPKFPINSDKRIK